MSVFTHYGPSQRTSEPQRTATVHTNSETRGALLMPEPQRQLGSWWTNKRVAMRDISGHIAAVPVDLPRSLTDEASEASDSDSVSVKRPVSDG